MIRIEKANAAMPESVALPPQKDLFNLSDRGSRAGYMTRLFQLSVGWRYVVYYIVKVNLCCVGAALLGALWSHRLLEIVIPETAAPAPCHVFFSH